MSSQTHESFLTSRSDLQTRVTVNIMSMGGGRRVAGVSVIITCQDDKAKEANLTSEEYDQLVKVSRAR